MSQSVPDPAPVYVAHDMVDLLSAVPTFFGFSPTESFIAVATHGERRRFGFRLRMDLPPAQHIAATADLVAMHLRRNGADGAVLLALTENLVVAESLVAATIEALHPDIEPVACAWANGYRYWEPLSGFPAEGVAYEASPHHLAVVSAVAAGQEILPDRQALADRWARCTGTTFESMRRATAVAAEQSCRALSGDTDGVAVSRALNQIDPILNVALAQEDRLSDHDVAMLSVWLSAWQVRDAVWQRIDRDSAHNWLRVLRDVSARVVPPFEPAVLALASFAGWLTGDGAQALIAVERAHAADPDYPLAQMMLQVVENGIPPTAWGPSIGAKSP